MHENNTALLDEALYEEPVKNTFRLSWEFISLNRQFTFTAMSLLLLLNILSLFLGVLAMVVSGIFSLTIQIYVAKLIYSSQDIGSFIEESKKSKVESAVSQNASVASGAYLGWITLLIIFLVVLVFTLKTMGLPLENVKTMDDFQPIINAIIFPLIILLLLLTYIHPLVQANINMAKDFREGFLAVFTVFSLTMWRESFQSKYPKYILSLMGIVLVGAFILAFIISIPGINLLASFIVVVVMYMYMVMISIAAMMGKRMIEG